MSRATAADVAEVTARLDDLERRVLNLGVDSEVAAERSQLLDELAKMREGLARVQVDG